MTCCVTWGMPRTSALSLHTSHSARKRAPPEPAPANSHKQEPRVPSERDPIGHLAPQGPEAPPLLCSSRRAHAPSRAPSAPAKIERTRRAGGRCGADRSSARTPSSSAIRSTCAPHARAAGVVRQQRPMRDVLRRRHLPPHHLCRLCRVHAAADPVARLLHRLHPALRGLPRRFRACARVAHAHHAHRSGRGADRVRQAVLPHLAFRRRYDPSRLPTSPSRREDYASKQAATS
eukprot:scaffold2041_cov110-Isochrysis_galbana.AAC.12